jgi:hypothetical protein
MVDQLLNDIAAQNTTIACLRENIAAMRRERGEIDKTLVHILLELRKLMDLLVSVNRRTWMILHKKGGKHGKTEDGAKKAIAIKRVRPTRKRRGAKRQGRRKLSNSRQISRPQRARAR